MLDLRWLCAAATLLISPAPSHADGLQGWATFVISNGPPSESFVIAITDEVKIKKARAIVSGNDLARVHVIGRIVKHTAPYNPGWHFHLDPASIDFFESGIKVCDAKTSSVQASLDKVGEAFLQQGWWCPWTSKVAQEIGSTETN